MMILYLSMDFLHMFFYHILYHVSVFHSSLAIHNFYFLLLCLSLLADNHLLIHLSRYLHLLFFLYFLQIPLCFLILMNMFYNCFRLIRIVLLLIFFYLFPRRHCSLILLKHIIFYLLFLKFLSNVLLLVDLVVFVMFLYQLYCHYYHLLLLLLYPLLLCNNILRKNLFRADYSNFL